MRTLALRFFSIILVILPVCISGCASVPKETVELSYTMGQDLDAVHASYKSLIHIHFENLRYQANDFLAKKWIPTYLANFIKKGNLSSLAQNPDPTKAFEGVSTWVEIAMEAIQQQRDKLLSPIDNDEQTVLAMVDDSFGNLTRANAAITAQLNSIRKVQEVQDNALKAFNLKELRDQINDKLIMASKKTESAIAQIEKANKAITDIDEKKQEIINKIKGGQ